jgi:hypothetical protein
MAPRILAENGVADVNVPDNEGHTALWHASHL